MSALAGKIAVVIGGQDGIGGAIAARFAAEGATVYATSRRAQAGEVAQGAGTLRPRRVDAADPAALARFFEGVRAEAGRIDVLAISAGTSGHARLEEVSEAHFDQIFGLNVRALLFATKAGTALMARGGAVVLVGSIADVIGTEGYGTYSASKAAVRSFARTWAKELAPRGIRVNVVAPGPTDTAMFAAATDEMRQAMTASIPLGRMGRPAEVAAAALFLASEESSFVTGAELPVDGGMTQV